MLIFRQKKFPSLPIIQFEEEPSPFGGGGEKVRQSFGNIGKLTCMDFDANQKKKIIFVKTNFFLPFEQQFISHKKFEDFDHRPYQSLFILSSFFKFPCFKSLDGTIANYKQELLINGGFYNFLGLT